MFKIQSEEKPLLKVKDHVGAKKGFKRKKLGHSYPLANLG